MAENDEELSNIEVSEFSRLAPTGPDWPRLAPIGPDWPRQSGGSQRAPDPTFTRAGGQDDVSLNKLPQINEFYNPQPSGPTYSFVSDPD